MSAPALQLRHVWRSFEPGRPVLKGLSVEVPLQGVTFVVGQSGQGKSVMCRLAVGLLKPDQGEVVLNGRRVDLLPERALMGLRRQTPYLVQAPALLDWLTAEQNVRLAAPRAPAERVRAALDRVGVAHHAKDYPARLGPGTRKRVALARALMLEPVFLLLDEPTTGLEQRAAGTVNDAIGHLSREGVGALIVSHDYRALALLADRVLWLSQGQVGFFGPTAQFLASTDPGIRALLEPAAA